MLLKRLFHIDDRKSLSGLPERRLTGKSFGKAKRNKDGAEQPFPLMNSFVCLGPVSWNDLHLCEGCQVASSGLTALRLENFQT